MLLCNFCTEWDCDYYPDDPECEWNGDKYEVNENSPVLFNYSPYRTKQDFDELNKALNKYRCDNDAMERWWTEEVRDEKRRLD